MNESRKYGRSPVHDLHFNLIVLLQKEKQQQQKNPKNCPQRRRRRTRQRGKLITQRNKQKSQKTNRRLGCKLKKNYACRRDIVKRESAHWRRRNWRVCVRVWWGLRGRFLYTLISLHTVHGPISWRACATVFAVAHRRQVDARRSEFVKVDVHLAHTLPFKRRKQTIKKENKHDRRRCCGYRRSCDRRRTSTTLK